MFCFQCEQTAKGEGCTKIGVCGKQPDVAALQDLLIYTLKGLALVAHQAREKGIVDGDLDGVGDRRGAVAWARKRTSPVGTWTRRDSAAWPSTAPPTPSEEGDGAGGASAEVESAESSAGSRGSVSPRP